MRDWELVLYKYANFSVMESECPDGSGPHRPTPAGVFPSAGSIPPGHSNFCLFSLSLVASFFSIFHPPRFYFSFYRVVTQKLGSFSLFYNNSGHYPEVILVCISFKVSQRNARLLPPCMQRRSKSTEILTIRCTSRFNSPSSI